MKKNLPALALASMLILSGCDRLGIGNPFSGKEISCGSEETKEILVKLVRDNVEGETVKTFDDDAFKDQAFADIGISHIRRMVERLGITVKSVSWRVKRQKPKHAWKSCTTVKKPLSTKWSGKRTRKNCQSGSEQRGSGTARRYCRNRYARVPQLAKRFGCQMRRRRRIRGGTI